MPNSKSIPAPTARRELALSVRSILDAHELMEIINQEKIMELKVKRLTPTASIPTRGSEHAAGLDLYADENATIHPGKWKLISTGISTEFEPGMYLRIAPRSGLAVKQGIDVLAGVVDSDYRGEVKVALINHGDKDFIVHQGDRIAQAILESITMADIREAEELSDTARGEGGYGSTGR